MTDILIRFFIKDPDNTEDPLVREAYGILAGAVGIITNLLLCVAKLLIGMFSGSIAIQADAVNNLSDIGSSVVTLIGFRLAGKPADSEHPFGHARIEYIAALIIGFLILVVGVELGRESISKIIAPTPVNFSVAAMVILAGSILLKFWMSRFTTKVGRRINSKAISASTMDSICDMISTGAILISTIIGYFNGINIDGYIGVLVAAFVIYAGIGILKDTMTPLMGEAPPPELVASLTEKLMKYEGILGYHDIMVHNYGPGRVIASLHAEVSAKSELFAIHEVIDQAEREIREEMGILLTIHLDPIMQDGEALNAARKDIEAVLADVDERLSFHDFRIISGEKQTNLIFDIVVPLGANSAQIADYKTRIRERARQKDPRYTCIIEADFDYTGTNKA